MSATPFANLHPLLVRAVAQALFSIFCEGRYADKVIEYILRHNPKAGGRDRAFIAETTYETVRYYRLYAEVLGKKPESEFEFWQITGIYLIDKGLRLPDWTEFRPLQKMDVPAKLARAREQRALRESIPDWIDELGMSELGDSLWNETLPQLNIPAKVVLRANRLKTDKFALQKLLFEQGVETEPVDNTDDALVLLQRRNVFQTQAFRTGLFEVQDYSSQLVAPFLDPKPGMRVVDACAGGGGKTLHLSALMQNKGILLALDTLTWKLDELRLRARRAGANNVETRPVEGTKTVKRLHRSADRLLLDVPCSGLGVLRRNPDSKWKLTPEQIEKLHQTQRQILRAYSTMLKPGGMMVYATCSILPSENRKQVDDFLSDPEGKGFTFIEEKRILPQDRGFDGFYMAKLALE